MAEFRARASFALAMGLAARRPSAHAEDRRSRRVDQRPHRLGHLVTALTAYPDAKEITTISLELARAPRRSAAPFRFGYLDSAKAMHVLVTHLPTPAAPRGVE